MLLLAFLIPCFYFFAFKPWALHVSAGSSTPVWQDQASRNQNQLGLKKSFHFLCFSEKNQHTEMQKLFYFIYQPDDCHFFIEMKFPSIGFLSLSFLKETSPSILVLISFHHLLKWLQIYQNWDIKYACEVASECWWFKAREDSQRPAMK